jgi:DNA-3-methyladenine glycosylase
MKLLKRNFYRNKPDVVARNLLGKILVRTVNGNIISGIIIETEAYLAYDDHASHAFKRPTNKTKSLYLDAGHAYVHHIHSHYCMDVVCEKVGIGGSVLIRAIEPIAGIELMQRNRNKQSLYDLASGPGKVCKALMINKNLDGVDLTEFDSPINIFESNISKSFETYVGKRIGIRRSRDLKLRFYIKDNKFISRR